LSGTTNRIMVAVDGSERSLRTAQRAIEWARLLNGSVVVVHVVQLPEYVAAEAQKKMSQELAARGEAAFEGARTIATEAGVPIETKPLETTGSVIAAICDAAVTERIDLLVVGKRTTRDVTKLMLGSVSEGVIANAKCDVLVVR
jgi:nucleotide-binding universal stress UspA family protein